MKVVLKYDLRAVAFGAAREDLYRACLDQCAWADREGFDAVRLHEHHRSEDGYLPSPIVMGAAIAARTDRLKIRLSVLVLPLHDPIRVAEDLAVLDILSEGRLELVVAAGYVAAEFAMFGKNVADRARLLEKNIEALRKAWTGEEFDFDGRRAMVRPLPYRGRSIPIYLGGSSVHAVRRAVRIGDGFEPVPHRLVDAYLAECERVGTPPGWYPGPGHELRLLHVAKDPDAAWERIRAHARHENDSYLAWTAPAGTDVGFTAVEHADDLRENGLYRIVTPDECVELLRPLGPDAEIHLHPLVGGLDLDLGWESLRLFRDEVRPRLEAVAPVGGEDGRR